MMSCHSRAGLSVTGYMPLQGSIPDMTADSESYIALQQVYRTKANEHVNKMYERAKQIKQSFQLVSKVSYSNDAYIPYKIIS